MNIKALLSIMALAALTACGDCVEPAVTAVSAPVVLLEPVAPVVTPEPVFVCAQSSDKCPPSPTPAPICQPVEEQGCAGDLDGCFPVKPCAV